MSRCVGVERQSVGIQARETCGEWQLWRAGVKSKGVARHQDYVFGVFIISAFFAFSTKK